MRSSFALASVFALSLVAPIAHASDIAWFPANRSIAISLDFVPFEPTQTPPAGDGAAGPPAGSWIDSASVESQYPFGGARAIGDAGQISSPSTTALACDLVAELDLQSDSVLDTAVSSTSSFQAYFALSSATEISLEGSLSASAFCERQTVSPPCAYEAIAQVELRQVGGVVGFADSAILDTFINQASGQLESSSTPLAWTYPLPAGIYEVTVSVSAHNFNPAFDRLLAYEPLRLSAGASVSIHAHVPPPHPCEGDLDGDGDTDLIDFARFQRCFDGPH